MDVPPGQIRAGGMLPHPSRPAVEPIGSRMRLQLLRGRLLPACCVLDRKKY